MNFKSLLLNNLFSITSVVAVPVLLYSGYRYITFSHLEIPIKRNISLIPKINTFTHKNCYFGRKTVLENGKRIIKTGRMLIFKPFVGIVSVKIDKRINELKDLQHDKIDIYCLTKNISENNLIEYIRNTNNEDPMIKVYYMSSDLEQPWYLCKNISRNKQPLYYNDTLINKIESSIDNFLHARHKYESKGRTYKLSMLFYGPYGSGKTSMVKHLAIKYGRDIYVLSLEEFFKEHGKPNSHILKACEGGILLLEDVDQYLASLYEKKHNPYISNMLTLLDGFSTPEDTIIIMTADYVETLPEALTRAGRMDNIIPFTYLDDEIIDKICNNYQFDKTRLDIKGHITTSDLVKNIENNLDTTEPIYIIGKHEDMSVC